MTYYVRSIDGNIEIIDGEWLHLYLPATEDGNPAEQYTTEGSVTVYPDGRIVQTFWIKNIQEQFFPADETGTGYQLHINDRSIPIALWTAMPNKVLSVSPQVLRGSNTSSSDAYYSEGAELPTVWALRKQGQNKTIVWLDMARIVGGSGNQRIDIFVVVEGY